jgi:hypothetical protein
MRPPARPLIRWNVRNEDSLSLAGLKERMTHAADPAERVVSTCPTGGWLDGLRASFDPEGSKHDSKPKQKGGLIAGRLRSV